MTASDAINVPLQSCHIALDMGDICSEARAYLSSVTSGVCTDSKDVKIRHLVLLQERLVENDTEHAHTSLNNSLLTALENIIDGVDTSAPRTDPLTPVAEEQGEIVYNSEAPDSASWAVETVTDVFFKDVVGADDGIQVIREAIILPTKFPLIFERAKANPWKGALLYGPPGTGKSLLARAAACEAGIPFFNTSCADLTSKWVGGSEKLVRGLFESARQSAPSIVFLDEIDSVASSREGEKSIADQRLTNQLLVEIDGNANKKRSVFVLAATNLPWNLVIINLTKLACLLF
tara:strand:+ start:4492 stop:5364 length:873 start_codon:yes stop_codon:yes gene_type:complete